MTSSSNYSASASALSLVLKYVSLMSAPEGREIERILEKMRGDFISNAQAEDEIDFFYGLMDRRSYTLSYSCSDGVIAFLWRASENSIEILNAESEPFSGQPEKSQIKVNQCSLDPKDRIIIVSNGFYHIENTKKKI